MKLEGSFYPKPLQAKPLFIDLVAHNGSDAVLCSIMGAVVHGNAVSPGSDWAGPAAGSKATVSENKRLRMSRVGGE